MIPNGLRLKKSVCLTNNNEQLKEQWNQTLWNASCKLRNISMDIAIHQNSQIESKIDRLKVQLWRNSSPETYYRHLNILHKQIMSLRNKLTIIKNNKLYKDRQLCQNEMVESRNLSAPTLSASPHTRSRNRKSKSRRFKRYKSKQLSNELYRNHDLTNNHDNNRDSVDSENADNSENNTKVVNLSNHALSRDEISLLSKGLSFCPTPPEIDPLRLDTDLKEFHRRMRLKDHFHSDDSDDSPEESDYTPNIFREKSTWTPKDCNPRLSVFHENFVKDLNKATTVKRKRDNLNRGERQALRQLRSNTDLVIKPADKGGAVVVMNRTDYVKKR